MSGLNVVLNEVQNAAQNAVPIGTQSAVADQARNAALTRIGHAELMGAMPALVHGQAGYLSVLSAGPSVDQSEIRIEAMSVRASACPIARSTAPTIVAATVTITTM
jgi:hypothetical protein